MLEGAKSRLRLGENIKPGDADVVKGGLEGEKGGILSVTAR